MLNGLGLCCIEAGFYEDAKIFCLQLLQDPGTAANKQLMEERLKKIEEHLKSTKPAATNI